MWVSNIVEASKWEYHEANDKKIIKWNKETIRNERLLKFIACPLTLITFVAYAARLFRYITFRCQHYKTKFFTATSTSVLF
jgi:hypothetical protein